MAFSFQATEISTLLSRAYSHVFDLGQLSVLEGSQCWALYVDILILECGGNLFDAVSMAVKAALFNTRFEATSETSIIHCQSFFPERFPVFLESRSPWLTEESLNSSSQTTLTTDTGWN